MTTMTSDEASNNVDAEKGQPRSTASAGATPATATDREITPEEKACVRRWQNAVKVSRAFDEEVRKMYAQDRMYARGETSATVQYSLIQAYIDILVAFLVARNPDFDCTPDPSVGQDGLDLAEMQCKTMEIIIGHLLRSARIKRKASRMVRSALTVGIGWLKATWQERWQSDPHIKDQLNDAQQNLAQINDLIRRIQAGEFTDLAAATAKLTELQAGMAQKSERIVASGMAIDVINPEDMIFSLDCDNVIDLDSSSWCGNRYFVHKDLAMADFEISEPVMSHAVMYSPRAPRNRRDQATNGAVAQVTEKDADSYVVGGTKGVDTALFVCCFEIWDAESNQFFTLIEGLMDRYAGPPQPPPCPTERFYPYFGLSFTEIDGDRHPQSLIQRSYKLQDEIERSMSQLITHRRRAIPKLGFDASKVTKATMENLEKGVTQEFIAIKFIKGVDPKMIDMSKVLFPIAYNQIDMALYSVDPMVRAMETVWGIQEALTSTVQVAKTATEADIQQAGTQAKTGFKRDILEDVLSDIGQYSAEIASYKITPEKARQIAGVEALWPQSMTAEELDTIMKVRVRAGSSGKPDNVARREAWAALVPQMKEMMGMIANFRQTPPNMLADNLEELLIETAERMGDVLNAKRFVPQAPQAPILGPNGMPMSNEQVATEQQAERDMAREGAKASGQTEVAAAEGQVPVPVPDGQQQLAPTATPVAIAG